MSLIQLEPNNCPVKQFANNCINDLGFIVDLHELYEKLTNFFCKKCLFRELDFCSLLEKSKFKRSIEKDAESH